MAARSASLPLWVKIIQNAFLTIGIILAIVFILAIGLTYFSTFERETDGTPEERKAIIEESSHKGENPLVSLWNMIKDMGSASGLNPLHFT